MYCMLECTSETHKQKRAICETELFDDCLSSENELIQQFAPVHCNLQCKCG